VFRTDRQVKAPTPLLGQAADSVHVQFAWLPPTVDSERLYSQSACLRSAVIFVKRRTVSIRTILPNFIDLSAETLYLRSGGHNGGVIKAEKRKRTSLI
jgi:hypothetical protein